MPLHDSPFGFICFRTPARWKCFVFPTRTRRFGADQRGRIARTLPHFHPLPAAIDNLEVIKVTANEIDIIDEYVLENGIVEHTILKERSHETSSRDMSINEFLFSPSVIQTIFLFRKSELSAEVLAIQVRIKTFHT